jgi:hypothetical protein
MMTNFKPFRDFILLSCATRLVLTLLVILLISSCSSNKTTIDKSSKQVLDMYYNSFYTHDLGNVYPQAVFQDSCGTYFYVIQAPMSSNSVHKGKNEVLRTGESYLLRLFRYDYVSTEGVFFGARVGQVLDHIDGQDVVIDLKMNVYYSPDLILTKDNVHLKISKDLPW